MEGLDRSNVAGQVRYLAHNPHYFTWVSGREYSEEAIITYVREILPYLSAGAARMNGKYVASPQALARARKHREERVARNQRMTQRRAMREELVKLQRSINTLW